jgi:hypothetical protein
MNNVLFNTYTFWKGVMNGVIQAMLITIPSVVILEQDTFIMDNG